MQIPASWSRGLRHATLNFDYEMRHWFDSGRRRNFQLLYGIFANPVL